MCLLSGEAQQHGRPSAKAWKALPDKTFQAFLYSSEVRLRLFCVVSLK